MPPDFSALIEGTDVRAAFTVPALAALQREVGDLRMVALIERLEELDVGLITIVAKHGLPAGFDLESAPLAAIKGALVEALWRRLFGTAPPREETPT